MIFFFVFNRLLFFFPSIETAKYRFVCVCKCDRVDICMDTFRSMRWCSLTVPSFSMDIRVHFLCVALICKVLVRTNHSAANRCMHIRVYWNEITTNTAFKCNLLHCLRHFTQTIFVFDSYHVPTSSFALFSIHWFWFQCACIASFVIWP